jgi:hypothetical protein
MGGLVCKPSIGHSSEQISVILNRFLKIYFYITLTSSHASSLQYVATCSAHSITIVVQLKL